MDAPAPVLTALASPQGRAAVASGNTSHLLRVVRRELQLRQEDVAARSGYSQATISRVEQGRLRDVTVIWDVAEALQIPPGVFRGLAGPSTFEPRVEDVERRDMLRAALAVASAAMLPAAVAEADRAKRIGTGAVKECWTALDRLHVLEAQHGGAAVYELTAGMAGRLRSALGTASYSLAVGKSLRQVTAATMIQAGWQAFDARRRDVARDWWLETLHIADLGDGVDEYRISALASLSRDATDAVRQGRDAVGLAQSASGVGGSSPRMLSLLAAREAIGHAALGDRRAAAACLRRARRQLDRGNAVDDPTWMRFWGPSDLAIHEMHVARFVGDTHAAERAARDAVGGADPDSMPRNHAIYAAHLGSALAQVGKYDEAIAVSQHVPSGSVKNGSHRVRAELRETARLLASAPYSAGREFAATVERLVPAS